MMVPQFCGRKSLGSFCDVWIMSFEVMKKPCPLQKTQDKLRARVAKNLLLVTLVPLSTGYRPLIEIYQRHAEDAGLHTLLL